MLFKNLAPSLGVALWFLTTTSYALPITYSVDDGTGETGIGVTGVGLGPQTVEWANQFNAVAGGETITDILVAFGSTSPDEPSLNGSAVTISLYDDVDNDGTPNDLSLLASIAGVVGNYGTDIFNTYDIIDTLVNDSFFVSATITFTPSDVGFFPARTDLTSSNGQSWIRLNDGNLIEDPFTSNYMIRANAEGAPVPAPATIALFGLGLAGLGWSRRKKV